MSDTALVLACVNDRCTRNLFINVGVTISNGEREGRGVALISDTPYLCLLVLMIDARLFSL